MVDIYQAASPLGKYAPLSPTLVWYMLTKNFFVIVVALLKNIRIS